MTYTRKQLAAAINVGREMNRRSAIKNHCRELIADTAARFLEPDGDEMTLAEAKSAVLEALK